MKEADRQDVYRAYRLTTLDGFGFVKTGGHARSRQSIRNPQEKPRRLRAPGLLLTRWLPVDDHEGSLGCPIVEPFCIAAF
jgi:hypothetical protein